MLNLQREGLTEENIMTVIITPETPSQRYSRIDMALYYLRKIHPSERTEEQREELRSLQASMDELLAAPPAGYTVPKAVTDLLAHAKAHGWLARASWTPPNYEGEPFLRVEVGRLVTDEEREEYRGDRWMYSLTWHSRDCAPGKVKRFGQGTAVTPDDPATHYAPSVKAIRAVIADNPAPVAADIAA
jgi:hypothetical protein